MLLRAWGVLGLVSAALVLFGFFAVLLSNGWTPGAAVGPGTSLHHAYLQATTITFLGIVACQIGTSFAARTDRVSLKSMGLTTNPLLLWGIAFEIGFAAVVVSVPILQRAFGTAVPVHCLGRGRVVALRPATAWLKTEEPTRRGEAGRLRSGIRTCSAAALRPGQRHRSPPGGRR